MPDKWKFKEDEYLKEMQSYIEKTYSSHYSGDDDDIQTFELIAKSSRLDRGLHFATGSGLKYLDRQGKKVGNERTDLLKAIHFGMLALYCFDRMNQQKDNESKDTE